MLHQPQPMMKTLLETLNYQPHGLTDKEFEHPEEAIAHFFEWHELYKARTNFQDFYIAWENYHSKNLTRGEKKEMVFFLKNLMLLVEAGFVMSYRLKEKDDFARDSRSENH